MKKSLILIALGVAAVSNAALITAQWDFNGNLNATLGANALQPSERLDGNEATAPATTEFLSDTIDGNPADVMRWTNNEFGNAYLIARTNQGPDFGFYRNAYSIAMDIRTEYNGTGQAWNSLAGTNFDTYNDGDFYIRYGALDANNEYTARLGIGSYGSNTFLPNRWNRIVITVDASNTVDGMKFYVNGTLLNSRSGGGLDGGWSLYTTADVTPWMILFGEGDSSGNYTQPLLVNSVAFYNDVLPDSEVAALGGPSAAGIPANPQVNFVGEITLGDWGGSNDASSVTFEVLDAGGSVVETSAATLNSSNKFGTAFQTTGVHDVYVNAPRFLRKKLGSFDLQNGVVTAPAVTLNNGDVDGDESVTIFDYIEISNSFDLNAGDPGFLPLADLDGDQSVTIFDYIILSNNFDLNGD